MGNTVDSHEKVSDHNEECRQSERKRFDAIEKANSSDVCLTFYFENVFPVVLFIHLYYFC